MKEIVKKCVLYALRMMAKFRLRNFKGKVVAITGSIGKTSTKEAIFKVLNSRFKVKRSKKSMNSDFGLLLTILDIESGYNSATKWMWYLTKAFWNSFTKDFSEVLLLEMGVDKPGDMDFLLSIVKPDIAVLTNISPVHMGGGQFASLQQIFEEKSKLFEALKEGGVAILNADNEFADKLSKRCPKRRVLTYGKSPEADYRISAVHADGDGISFSLFHKDEKVAINSSVLGDFQAHVLAPAYICAEILQMPLETILESLARYSLPPGRMNSIEAKNGAKIIDSSYNSSPEALQEALILLDKLAGGKSRRVAVLGMMNELGEQSREFHLLIGENIPKYADFLIAVGADAKYFAQGALEKGMPEKNIRVFSNVKEAIEFFEGELKEDDLVLVKGSQNRVRMERFVKAFMAHPEDAKDLLVRQEKEWINKI